MLWVYFVLVPKFSSFSKKKLICFRLLENLSLHFVEWLTQGPVFLHHQRRPKKQNELQKSSLHILHSEIFGFVDFCWLFILLCGAALCIITEWLYLYDLHENERLNNVRNKIHFAVEVLIFFLNKGNCFFKYVRLNNYIHN